MTSQRTNGQLMLTAAQERVEMQEAGGSQVRWDSLALQGFQEPLEYPVTLDLPDHSRT